MDNITVDLGDEPVERGTEAVLIGARGDERILAEDLGARAGHHQLRGDVRHQPARAARTRVSEALRGARARGAGRRGARGWSAAPCATSCSGATPTTSTSRSPATRSGSRASWPRPPAGRRSSSAARSAPGASSGREHAWHVDLVTLRDDDIDADLAQRDFTINAMAEPLERRRAARPARRPRGSRAAARADGLRRRRSQDDPLRSLRAIRIAVELEPRDRPRDGRARSRPTRAGSSASRPSACSPSSSASINADAVRRGLALMDAHGLTDVVLPELSALQGDRAEPLPPRRRPRPHARGARPGRAAAARPGLPARARRAAVGRAHARPGDALGRAPARRRQAADARLPAPTAG